MKIFNGVNKKISFPIAIIIIVVCAVLVGGLVVWQYLEILKQEEKLIDSGKIELKTEIRLKEAIENCENVNQGSLRHVCILSICDIAKPIEENIQKCNEIDFANISSKESCLMSIIPKTIEVCENVPGSTYDRGGQKDDCYLSVAKKEGDDLICDKIDDRIFTRIDCYKTVAIIKKDPEICQKIDYNYFLNWCLENSETYLCKHMSGWYEEYSMDKNWCLAVTTGDISKCAENKGAYKNKCYRDVAKNKNDPSICEKITDTYFKDECYTSIAELRKAPSLCDEVDNKKGSRDLCYLTALKEIDYSFCEEAQEKIKYSCYIYLAKENRDLSACFNRFGYEAETYYYCHLPILESIAEKLNKDFDEENQSLYDNYCREKSSFEYIFSGEFYLEYEAERKKEIEEEESKYPNCGYEKGEYEMRAYDSQERVTGLVNGETKWEIPDSFHHDSYYVGVEYFPQRVLIFNPSDSYVYEFFGLEDGSYNFSHSFNQKLGYFGIEDTFYQGIERKEFNFNAYNIPLLSGQVHQYHIDWETFKQGGEGVTLLIDSNNDGVFEKTIKSDRELTCEEFIKERIRIKNIIIQD